MSEQLFADWVAALPVLLPAMALYAWLGVATFVSFREHFEWRNWAVLLCAIAWPATWTYMAAAYFALWLMEGKKP